MLTARVRRASRLLAFALSAIWVISLPQVARSADSLWTFRAPGEVGFVRVTLPGTLLVATDSALVGIEQETGTMLWSRPDLAALSPIAFDLLPLSRFALLHRPTVRPAGAALELIDVRTGRTQWDSDSLPIEVSRETWFLPRQGLLLVLSVSRSQADSSDTYTRFASGAFSRGRRMDDPGPWRIIAVDAETGMVRWQAENWFASAPATYCVIRDGHVFRRRTTDPSRSLLIDSDSTSIVYVSDDGPISVDIRNGQVRWRAGGSARVWSIRSARGAASPMATLGGVAYIANGREVMALGTADGVPRWKKPAKVGHEIVQMEWTPRGVLVGATVRAQKWYDPYGPTRQKGVLDLRELDSGRSAWMRPVKYWMPATPFCVKGEYAYVAAEGYLTRVAIDSGVWADLGRVRFQGHEHPLALELLPEGFLLRSSQNVELRDSLGLVRGKYYGEAPHLIAPALSLVVNLAATAAGVHMAATLLVGSAVGTVAPLFLVDLGTPSLEAAMELAPLLVMGLPALTQTLLGREYRMGQNLSRYSYIFTTVEDSTGSHGPGLVKVDNASGHVIDQIVLGTLKPRYDLDLAESLLFFRPDPRRIVAYRF